MGLYLDKEHNYCHYTKSKISDSKRSGNIQISNFKLKNVLNAPNFDFHLIPVSKQANDFGCTLTFLSDYVTYKIYLSRM